MPYDAIRDAGAVGFTSEQIQLDLPTREAALKWALVVNDSLSAGRNANAAASVAAATSLEVTGLLGPGGTDADGSAHAGLPWLGCTVVQASQEKLQRIRNKALNREDVFLADMPVLAQETRVYQEYLQRLSGATSSEVEYAALSVVGPRKYIERLIGGLSLLT